MRPRLLVVDDEARHMEALCRTLTPEGYDVTGCSAPAQALAALREQPFDVLLTDLMMPGMDGIELLAAALDIDPDLVGVMMTGHGTVGSAVEAMKAGALDYILKPFNLSAIRPVLARAVDVRRLRLENIRLREAVGIHELSTAIARSLDSATILERTADAAFQQSRARDVRMYVTNAAGTELRLAVARSRDATPPIGSVLPVTPMIAEWVSRQRAWLDVDPHAEPPASPDPVMLPPRLSVPMLVDNRFTGLLVFEPSAPYRPMSAGQIKSLSVLAGACATALEVSTLLEHLRRSNDDLRKFAWAASHDLQEPLREVALSTQLLVRRQGDLDPESGALARAAADGARRMLDMVQELRTFVEAGATPADVSATADSGAALDRAVAELQEAIEASGAAIVRGELPAVRMREADLAQVFRRLLDNAIKFRRSGSAPRIEVGAARDRGGWTLSVSDTGIGIAPDYHALIFEPFRRLNRREEYDGNGMGLPVCRRLVEAYGGRVWVESREGEGARFFVSVPAVTTAPATAATPS
jgi:signal transduction histidine kinase